MLEMIVAAIKTLPHWLSMVAEVLLVTVLFSFAAIFLFGMWTGIRIIGRRANEIESITIVPFGIKFRDNDK